MTTTLSRRGFNQDTGRAKTAAAARPVFITDRGVPAYVLLSIEAYRHRHDLRVAEGEGRQGRSQRDGLARTIPTGNLFPSVIVIQGLEIGVLLAERRDPVKGGILRSWLDDHVLPGFSERILPIDMVWPIEVRAKLDRRGK